MESSPRLGEGPDAPRAAAARLREMIMGFRVTQMLYVAAKLNLADHLAHAPQTAERLAAVSVRILRHSAASCER